MICVSCAGKLESSMKHAMLANLCPFCGQNIFTLAEADFRKSIFRILLKNGIDDDDLIVRLVDDISGALRKNISPAEEMALARTARSAKRQALVEQQIGEEIEVGADDVDESDIDDDDDESELPPNARNAPSRVLTPDPNRAMAAPDKPSNLSKVDLAMRAFEQIDKEAKDNGSEEFVEGEDDSADELERQFLASSGIKPSARTLPGGPKRPGKFTTVARKAE